VEELVYGLIIPIIPIVFIKRPPLFVFHEFIFSLKSTSQSFGFYLLLFPCDDGLDGGVVLVIIDDLRRVSLFDFFFNCPNGFAGSFLDYQLGSIGFDKIAVLLPYNLSLKFLI